MGVLLGKDMGIACVCVWGWCRLCWHRFNNYYQDYSLHLPARAGKASNPPATPPRMPVDFNYIINVIYFLMYILHPVNLDFLFFLKCISTSFKEHAWTCFQSNMAMWEFKWHQSLIMLIHVGEERNRQEQLLAWINAAASKCHSNACRCPQHVNWFIDSCGLSHARSHGTSRWLCPTVSGCVIYALGCFARSHIYSVTEKKVTITERFFSSPSQPITVLVVFTWYLHSCCNSYIFKVVHVCSSYAICNNPLTSINPA